MNTYRNFADHPGCVVPCPSMLQGLAPDSKQTDKKLLVTSALLSSNKKLLGTNGLTTRSKGHRY